MGMLMIALGAVNAWSSGWDRANVSWHRSASGALSTSYPGREGQDDSRDE